MSIIGNPIMAGASGPAASIFVTGLSETDNVTATKGGKTLTGKWKSDPNPAFHGLPDGYTELEYIESTGTQYINTGISAPDGFGAVFDFSLTSVSTSDEYLIGSEESSSPYNCNFFRFHSSKWEVGANTVKTYTDSVPIVGERYYLEVSTVKNNVYLKINNDSLITSTDSNTRSSKTLYLFARYNGTSVSGCSKTRLFSCKLTVNANLIHNYIPAKRNSDSAIGLYDLVSGTFFENSGTGEFIAGAEIPQTIDGFLIKPIRDFGTWTVTATDGTKTATQDVLVDVITEYEIKMSLSA